MNRQVLMKTQQPTSVPPLTSGVLQRTCACGNHTIAGGKCDGCRQNSQATLRRASINPIMTNQAPLGQQTSASSWNTIRQMRQSGECGTLTGVNTGRILAGLGSGQALPPTVRQNTETVWGTDFSRVHVHTNPAAERLSELTGAKAFTIGNHIGFSHGAYQPHTEAGQELLHHELAHTLETKGQEDGLHGWFSSRINRGQTPSYRLNGENKEVRVGGDSLGNTHEDLTTQALDQLHAKGVVYSVRATEIILWWVGEIDHWKTSTPQTLADLAARESRPGRADFPELAMMIGEAGERQAVGRLHAYGGTEPSAIGIAERTLTGGGAIGTLLNEAIRNFNGGAQAHALRLLGISLHTIQDYYAHHVPLRDNAGRDLRALGRAEGGNDNVSVLEDQPNLDRTRWDDARKMTILQLQQFYDGIIDRNQLQHFGER